MRTHHLAICLRPIFADTYVSYSWLPILFIWLNFNVFLGDLLSIPASSYRCVKSPVPPTTSYSVSIVFTSRSVGSDPFICWLIIGLKPLKCFSVCIFFWPYIPSQGSVSAPFSTALFLLPHISVSLLYFTAAVTNILYNVQNVGIPGHYFITASVNCSTFRCTMNAI